MSMKPRFGQPLTGIVGAILILIVTWVTWFILADPEIGIFKLYDQPFLYLCIWLIQVAVWISLNFGMWPFSKLKQPACGMVATLWLIVGVAMVHIGFNLWGQFDPAFTFPDGYAAATFPVLIGFFVTIAWAVAWGGWPWHKAGQPASGAGQLLGGLFVTFAIWAFLMFPWFATWAGQTLVAPIDLNFVIGYWYDAIVALLLITFLWGNWPFTGLKEQPWIGIAITIASFLMGYLIYLIFYEIGMMTAPDVTPALAAMNGAQIGVIFNMVLVGWVVYADNWPTKYGTFTNVVVRTILVCVFSAILYVLYYNFATLLFNEPAGFWGKQPLITADWVILLMLLHFTFFGKWPLLKATSES